MGKRIVMSIYEGTVSGAVSDAFAVIEELAGEMRDAYDNTPESLQQSGVGEARGEAADTLEGINAPDMPDGALADTAEKFEYKPLGRRASRADRLGEGVNVAAQAIDALTKAAKDKGDDGYDPELEDERNSLIDEIQNMIDEAEGVSFPGMYG